MYTLPFRNDSGVDSFRRLLQDFTRRLFLAASALASLVRVPAFARTGGSGADQRLLYLQPAANWNEALPIGNGRLGAMVFGRVAQERLQLNEDTLWAGAPYTPDNPDALAAIPEVRRLIEQGRFDEATELASAKVMAKPLSQMSYGTLGDVLINFEGATIPTRYERSLDLETAIASTNYHSNGDRFRRSAFVSAPHQVLVFHLEAENGTLNFAHYRGPRQVKYTSPAYAGSATTLIDGAAVEWLMAEPAGPTVADVQRAADGPDSLMITGRNSAGPGVASGLTFALRIKVLSDGHVTLRNGNAIVREARRATLLIAGATSYLGYQDVERRPRRESAQRHRGGRAKIAPGSRARAHS